MTGRMKAIALSLVGLCFVSTLRAEIIEKPIEYTSSGVTCEGVHVVDTAKTGPRGSVLVVHQWTGISDHEKERAHRLAEQGYNVFIADIYGKGIRPQPPASGKEAGKYKKDRTLLRTRLNDALDVLKKLPETDATKIGAIGFCFGGTSVVELARSGAAVKGVVSFHGGLDSPTPADGKNIKGEILACHGADDPFVPAADLKAFEDELTAASVKYQLIKYPGAVHAFTQKAAGNDNSKGAAYNEAADKSSWASMTEFFARVLK